MTIGIGVLATTEEGRNRGVFPDHAILLSDTMGSFGDEYSHPRLHKSFHFPESKWYAVSADRVDKAAELVPMIDQHIAAVPFDSRTYGAVLHAIGKACFLYKMDRFINEVMPKHRIPPEMFDPFKVTPEINSILQPAWEAFAIDCDLLIAAFDARGQAYLIAVDGMTATAEGVGLPGFCAIGAGAPNAMFWLAHRAQHLGMRPIRSLYHAYEAKLMAEDSPKVNDQVDVTVANVEAHWWCTSHTTEAEQREVPEFPLGSLKELFVQYSPRPTEELDKIKKRLVKPSTPQTSEDQR